MYSAVHGAIGVSIVVATYALTGNETIAMAFGGVLAFLSHDPTDRLGEKGLGKDSWKYELPTFVIAMLGGLFTGHFWMFWIGFTAANLMDIWDKKMYLSIIFPSKFKSSHDFPCHRRKSDVQFTLKQTRRSKS